MRSNGSIFGTSGKLDHQNDMYQTREQIEVLLYNNKRAFLDMLESNQQFRDNFQKLLEKWNNSDIVRLASFLQTQDYRNPINEKVVIVEPVAMAFYGWSMQNMKEMADNKYHNLSSFEEYQKRQQKEELELQEQQRVKLQERRTKEALKEEGERYHKQAEIGIKMAEQHYTATLRNFAKSVARFEASNKGVVLNERYTEMLEQEHGNVMEMLNGFFINFMKMPQDDKLKVLVNTTTSLFAAAKDNPEKMYEVLGKYINTAWAKDLEGLSEEDRMIKIREMMNSPNNAIYMAKIVEEMHKENPANLNPEKMAQMVKQVAGRESVYAVATQAHESQHRGINLLEKMITQVQNNRYEDYESIERSISVNFSALEKTYEEHQLQQEQEIKNRGVKHHV